MSKKYKKKNKTERGKGKRNKEKMQTKNFPEIEIENVKIKGTTKDGKEVELFMDKSVFFEWKDKLKNEI